MTSKTKIAATNGQASAPTPMMAQYLEIKAAHEDALLFYRMGDFYELFFDDAVTAAAALNITLTHRGQHMGKHIPMCGVPFHAAEGYLENLIKQGFRVAVCEQTEDPAEAKKRGTKSVVRRDVVRLVTAGTLSEDALLDARTDNYLAALGVAGDELALAWLDISTGAVAVATLSANELEAQLARLAPRELVVPDMPVGHALIEKMSESAMAHFVAPPVSLKAAERRIGEVYAIATLDGFGLESRVEIVALGQALTYLQATQLDNMPRLNPPQIEKMAQFMGLDVATRANLELTHTPAGTRRGSLLDCIDETVTAAGARLLMTRLAAPLLDIAAIAARHDSIDFFLHEERLRQAVRTKLKAAPDMARALSRLGQQRGGPRDLRTLAVGLDCVNDLVGLLNAVENMPAELLAVIDTLQDAQKPLGVLAEQLSAALDDNMPLLARDGGFVRTDYHAGLDKARGLRDESRRVIAGLQQKYADETGIKTLKIKHNGVLGYHIDVPAQHGDKLMKPPFDALFIHRQTLANAVRFSTGELAGLAAEISRAGETALTLELEIFDQLVEDVLAVRSGLLARADALAIFDVSAALAEAAETHHWVRPSMYEDTRFFVEGARHPVVEAALTSNRDRPFIANECRLDAAAQSDPRVLLLTGPNMAGKSTFLRQNALLAIVAQMGGFVPAKKAEIGIVDRVFSRVGAADDLARGRSTFMVEMVETAAILNQAGPRALVILDEIGRGTATFDGLSIAWAAVEYLHDGPGCRTLFATHYHEMTALAERLKGLANASMKVREHNGQLIFLHEVGEGAADRSYGIHVAQLAGLPQSVIERARAILALLEENRAANDQISGDQISGGQISGKGSSALNELPLFDAQRVSAPAQDGLRTALETIDPDRLTPREALDWLYRLKEIGGEK